MACRAASAPAGTALLGLLICRPVQAGVELGVGLDASMDLADAELGLPATNMGTGIGLRAPTRFRLADGVAIRADPTLGITWGQDRVEWLAYDGIVPVYSENHGTVLTTVGFMVGPELSPWTGAAAAPYMGTSACIVWARHWHRFAGQEESLLGLSSEGEGIHPYTDQLATMVDLHGGVRIGLGQGLAIEVEAGYNVAFMREARLAQVPPALEAVRTAYGLNQLRIGLNLVIPLAIGSES